MPFRISRFRFTVSLFACLAACGDASPLFDGGPADAGTDAPSDTLSDPSMADAPVEDAALDAEPELTDASVVDSGPALPALLSETGLFVGGVDSAYASGVRPYDVRFPLWTDGAEKLRHMLVPPGGVIDTRDPNGWVFPIGTRLFKEFRVDGVPVETRLMWKVDVDYWTYVAYRYRGDGSDADAVPDGESNVRSTGHDVPDQSQCRNCHHGGADFVLGIGAIQLDRVTWDAWVEDGVLDAEAERGEPPGTAVEQEALGYLHGNCGHCHNEYHSAGEVRSLRLWLPVGVDEADAAPAWQTTAGVAAFHEVEGTRLLVVPGSSNQSQLFVRMGVRGDVQMPPLGTELVDPPGMEAVRAWIER